MYACPSTSNKALRAFTSKEEIHGLVPPCLLPSSCYLIVAAQGYIVDIVLSSGNSDHLQHETFTSKATSPPSTSPNHREFVPIG